ncbi:mannosyltransferase putative-domain-containing protein [Podospora didyma]|uniref:Mannosyltransferase putative-domain-containing protein n=1 Tax=Podospora didyma TaxID=330526 RepID=A0AAE0NXW9_9PEZI|nr:mannosyltransferase putative-domain-containing protein [Podospora didyma]
MGEAWSRKARFVVLTLPLLFTIIYFLNNYNYGIRQPRPIDQQTSYTNGKGKGSGKGNDNGLRPPSTHGGSDWWAEFFSRLETVRPYAAPVAFEGRARADNWKPDVDYERPDMIQMAAMDESNLRASHASFISQLPNFARHLPFARNTTGIVTTAGTKNFGMVVSFALMVRQTGSRLPIEVVLDSAAPWVKKLCTHTLAPMDVKCLYLEDAWRGLDTTVAMPKFERFQWKAISIVACSFQNVLFLDADALPVLKPDPVFAPGAEPYTSYGFITYPDFWTPSSSPLFYAIAGDVDVPPLNARTTSESGVMWIDKARHADTILLAVYYNYFGPDHYYAMLTQHGPGEGDKETFFHAALILDTLSRKTGGYQQPLEWTKNADGKKKGYWDIKKMPKVHGRTAKGKWRGMFMMQIDPREDYRAETQKLKSVKHTIGARGLDERYFTDSSFLGHISNLTFNQDDRLYMFFHHNGAKLDFTQINDEESGLVATNDEERYVRLWGNPDWIIDRTGRDVERRLFTDAMAIWCETEFHEVCDKMKQIHAQAY